MGNFFGGNNYKDQYNHLREMISKIDLKNADMCKKLGLDEKVVKEYADQNKPLDYNFWVRNFGASSDNKNVYFEKAISRFNQLFIEKLSVEHGYDYLAAVNEVAAFWANDDIREASILEEESIFRALDGTLAGMDSVGKECLINFLNHMDDVIYEKEKVVNEDDDIIEKKTVNDDDDIIEKKTDADRYNDDILDNGMDEAKAAKKNMVIHEDTYKKFGGDVKAEILKSLDSMIEAIEDSGKKTYFDHNSDLSAKMYKAICTLRDSVNNGKITSSQEFARQISPVATLAYSYLHHKSVDGINVRAAGKIVAADTLIELYSQVSANGEVEIPVVRKEDITLDNARNIISNGGNVMEFTGDTPDEDRIVKFDHSLSEAIAERHKPGNAANIEEGPSMMK